MNLASTTKVATREDLRAAALAAKWPHSAVAVRAIRLAVVELAGLRHSWPAFSTALARVAAPTY